MMHMRHLSCLVASTGLTSLAFQPLHCYMYQLPGCSHADNSRLTVLTSLSSLRRLKLSQLQLNHVGVSHLQQLPLLEALKVHSLHITDELPPPGGHLSKLKQYKQVSDLQPYCLLHMLHSACQLKRPPLSLALACKDNHLPATERGAEKVGAALRAVLQWPCAAGHKHIQLTGGLGQGQEVPPHVLGALSPLGSTLTDCLLSNMQLTAEHLEVLATTCPALRHVRLSRSILHQGALLPLLHLTSLTRLIMSSCSHEGSHGHLHLDDMLEFVRAMSRPLHMELCFCSVPGNVGLLQSCNPLVKVKGDTALVVASDSADSEDDDDINGDKGLHLQEPPKAEQLE